MATYSFGKSSLEKLNGVHPALQDLCFALLMYTDVSVIYGKRTEAQQQILVQQGLSKTMNSKHLIQPDGFAHAVDVAPYPLDWDDSKRYYRLFGLMEALAPYHFPKGAYLRWGGNWDCDDDLNDQSFMDLVHFEIRFNE